MFSFFKVHISWIGFDRFVYLFTISIHTIYSGVCVSSIRFGANVFYGLDRQWMVRTMRTDAQVLKTKSRPNQPSFTQYIDENAQEIRHLHTWKTERDSDIWLAWKVSGELDGFVEMLFFSIYPNTMTTICYHCYKWLAHQAPTIWVCNGMCMKVLIHSNDGLVKSREQLKLTVNSSIVIVIVAVTVTVTANVNVCVCMYACNI